MSRKKYNFKQRRNQLISSGFSAIEIRSIIYKEFGIHSDLASINKLISKANTGKESKVPSKSQEKTKNLERFTPPVNQEKLNGQETLYKLSQQVSKLNFQLNIQDERLRSVVFSVIRDNTITQEEKLHLQKKSAEYGYQGDIIRDVEKALNQNNPYLDDLIHEIHNDALIEPQEVDHLLQAGNEIGLSQDYLSYRFWVISFTYYPAHFKKFNSYLFTIKLLHTYFNHTGDYFPAQDFLSCFGPLTPNNLDESISSANYILAGMIADRIKWSRQRLENESRAHDFDTNKWANPSYEHLRIPQQLYTYLKTIINQQASTIGDPATDLMAENLIRLLSQPK